MTFKHGSDCYHHVVAYFETISWLRSSDIIEIARSLSRDGPSVPCGGGEVIWTRVTNRRKLCSFLFPGF